MTMHPSMAHLLAPFARPATAPSYPFDLEYEFEDLELPGDLLAFGIATIEYGASGGWEIAEIKVDSLIDSDGLPIRLGAFPIERHIRDALQLTRTDRIEAAVWAALPEERWEEEHRLCAAALGVGRAA